MDKICVINLTTAYQKNICNNVVIIFISIHLQQRIKF